MFESQTDTEVITHLIDRDSLYQGDFFTAVQQTTQQLHRAYALAGVTDQIIYLEEGDVIDVQLSGYRITDRHAQTVQREIKTVHAHGLAAELGPYPHYMQKEIFEQPRAISDTLEGIVGITPELFGDQAEDVFKSIDSVLILAGKGGQSSHARPFKGRARTHPPPSHAPPPCRIASRAGPKTPNAAHRQACCCGLFRRVQL